MKPRTRIKVIIIHPEKQHSFRLLSALKLHSSNIDVKFYTSVGFNSESLFLKALSFSPRFIRTRLSNHTFNPEDDVIGVSSFLYLIFALVRFFDKDRIIVKKLYPLYLKFFNYKVLRKLGKSTETDVVILFDSVSGELVRDIKEMNPKVKIFTDMSAPYYPYMVDVFKSILPKQVEEKIFFDEFRFKNSVIECKYSDYFFCASDFTSKSLTEYKVNPSRIKKLKYGIELNQEQGGVRNLNIFKDKFRMLFVGNVCYEKGVNTLLNAVKGLPHKLNLKLEVVLVGEYRKNNFDVNLAPSNFSFTGHLTKAELEQVYKSSDFFVFPSLSDGYGFVVSEAISFGLPVICSRNSGSSELVMDGVNGFLFDAGNEDQLRQIITNLLTNEFALDTKNRCIDEFNYQSWSDYSNDLYKIIRSVS